jgi:hypothetical protein
VLEVTATVEQFENTGRNRMRCRTRLGHVGKAKNLRQRLRSYRVANPEFFPVFAVFFARFCACCRISTKSFIMKENLREAKYSVYWPKVTRIGLHELFRENKKPFRIARNGVVQPRLMSLPRP